MQGHTETQNSHQLSGLWEEAGLRKENQCRGLEEGVQTCSVKPGGKLTISAHLD